MTAPSLPQALSLPGDALAADALGRPQLVGGACAACGSKMFPFAPVCPACMSEDIARERLARRGTLYTFTILHVGPKMWHKPFAVGYVDLDDGVRVFGHLRGSGLSIGQQVELSTDLVGKAADGRDISTFVFSPVRG